ncbi:MAG: quinone oxidoreductase, YhdH/YhfP family [Acidimicrobiaceae bacterium]|nr:quinone oxidoreductase, YhdH/YhfP family [Acidimicrobiaceae bacterium]
MAVRALLAAEPGGPPARLDEIETSDLDPGPVTVEVAWSGLNYKDALAITGRAPVIRRFPAICGVDLSGTVRAVPPGNAGVAVGAEVVVTGFGLGEGGMRGGLADLAMVRPEWCVPVPEGRSGRWAMAFGTAGLTAMLAVLALERGGPAGTTAPSQLPVLVTGAAGGVGSVAVALLAGLGREVIAVTGRPAEEARLRSLGAREVLGREAVVELGRRPLASERFGGVVDVAGGPLLTGAIAATCRDGVVAVCGLAASAELVGTLYPFILRGVSLVGIDSVLAPHALRARAWARLSELLPEGLPGDWNQSIDLEQSLALAEPLLAGEVRGHLVVEIAGG